MFTKRARSPRGAAALILFGALAACSYDFGREWTDPPVPGDAWRPPDAGVPIDKGSPTTPDAAWPPAPATVPALCFDGDKAVRTVSCPPGWAAIAGATDCEQRAIERFGLSTDGSGWTVTCSGGGKPLFTEVICARGEGFRRLSAKGVRGSSAVARCEAWEVVVSGGCECPGGMVRTNDYTQGQESWSCACDETATPVAHAICFHAGTATRLGRSVNRASATGALHSAVTCTKGVVLTGGCGADRSLSALALGDADDSWVCAFVEPAPAAALTAICVSGKLSPCP